MSSLKPLIEKQTLKIDDENRGNREIKTFDKDRNVHIHKRTNDNKNFIEIKIPINSDRELEIKNNKKEGTIPSWLMKEIKEALNEPEKLKAFIYDVRRVLKNYSISIENNKSVIEDNEIVKAILDRIAKHLDINIAEEYYELFNKEGRPVAYVQKYIDNKNRKYFSKVTSESFEVGQISGRTMVYGRYLQRNKNRR